MTDTLVSTPTRNLLALHVLSNFTDASWCPECEALFATKAEALAHADVCPDVRVACDQCHQPVVRRDLPQHHDVMCPKRAVPCMNRGCTARVPADAFANHRTTCDYQLRESAILRLYDKAVHDAHAGCVDRAPFDQSERHRDHFSSVVGRCSVCRECVTLNHIVEHQRQCIIDHMYQQLSLSELPQRNIIVVKYCLEKGALIPIYGLVNM